MELALQDSFAWALEFISKVMEFSKFLLMREMLKEPPASRFSSLCQ